MEAAVAALEAATEKTAGAASAAKEAAVAASAAATEAAGAATAAKEAAAAALATAKQAAAASLVAKEAAMAAEAAAKESAAAAAATAKELAAAMRYSKKRTFHQIEEGGRGGGSRDDGGSLDLISALPDNVLGTIISLLPTTKDGARTQAISCRWLPLWTIKFEVDEKKGKLIPSVSNIKLIASVSKILSEHRGHGRRLFLLLLNATDFPAPGGECNIDGWLRSQALDGLHELHFYYTSERVMPLSLFRFAPTLRFAMFGLCGFPESISTLRLNFPCLKQLTLFSVTITEDGLHNMLSGCTALESLDLRSTSGIVGLCIISQTLRSLCFSTGCENGVIMQLVIKDAPSLERLLLVPPLPKSGPVIIRVIQAPKLEILSLQSRGILKLQFGTTVFQKMMVVSLTTKIRTMKVLVLDSIGPNLGAVLDFLKCFPCLVRLYIIFFRLINKFFLAIGEPFGKSTNIF